MRDFNRQYESIIMEDYKGKSTALLKCERLLAKIIPKCTNKGFVINEMKEVTELEDTLKKFFNFKSVVINFYHTRSRFSSKNAYTHPSSFKVVDMTTVRRNGMKAFTKHALADTRHIRANVNVSTDLIVEQGLEPDEVLAVILHEFGHDVDASVYNNFVSYFMAFAFLSHFNLIALGLHLWPETGNIVTQIKKWVGDIITKYLKPIAILMNFFEAILRNVGEIGTLISFLSIPIANPITAIPAALQSYMTGISIARYQMENTADSFPTKYGYGPALGRALAKIGRSPDIPVTKVMEQIPVIKIMYEISELNLMIISSMIGVHPQGITRITNQIKLLEEDLEDPSIPKSYKKDIQKDIDTLKAFVEKDMMNAESDINRGKAIRALYIGMVYNMGGNTNIRDFLPTARL